MKIGGRRWLEIGLVFLKGPREARGYVLRVVTPPADSVRFEATLEVNNPRTRGSDLDLLLLARKLCRK